jgi:ATP phosphoribosyltransferase regulatory subunit HisZ
MAKKKGFMTPERKKKLRTLLRKKAAEELKKEEERKREERQKTIVERCGIKTDLVGKHEWLNTLKSWKKVLVCQREGAGGVKDPQNNP